MTLVAESSLRDVGMCVILIGLVTRLGVPIFADADEDGASHHLWLSGRLFQM